MPYEQICFEWHIHEHQASKKTHLHCIQQLHLTTKIKLSPWQWNQYKIQRVIIFHRVKAGLLNNTTYNTAFGYKVNLIKSRIDSTSIYIWICRGYNHNMGPGQRSQYSDSLMTRKSGDRTLVGLRFSAPIQTGPGAHLASYTTGTGSFARSKVARVWRWPPTTI